MEFSRKPLIACVHLLPTPGAPLYDGDLRRVYDVALEEARTYTRHGVDALVVENFRDAPFYPDRVPAETVATISGVTREIIREVSIPVGVAVLRNDATSAMAIAAAVGAAFVRVNIHIGAVLSEQGFVQGKSHETLRLRQALRADVKIFADAAVKHSIPLAYPDLAQEATDLSNRSDAVIVSGPKTGLETDPHDLVVAKERCNVPVLIGSGVTPENLHTVYELADGFIVGTYFKVNGNSSGIVDERRVEKFMECLTRLRTGSILPV